MCKTMFFSKKKFLPEISTKKFGGGEKDMIFPL